MYEYLLFLAVTFDHFEILRAIGKGSFGKVSFLNTEVVFACMTKPVAVQGIRTSKRLTFESSLQIYGILLCLT